MDDIRPFSDDIDPLLALIQKPESLPLAFQAIHAYRVRMQELLAAAKRAEAERTEREVRLNCFDGFTEVASRKIAYNDLAFFRAELARELHEAVAQERQRLKATLNRLADDEERPECE
jgi:hypothetical protein